MVSSAYFGGPNIPNLSLGVGNRMSRETYSLGLHDPI